MTLIGGKWTALFVHGSKERSPMSSSRSPPCLHQRHAPFGSGSRSSLSATMRPTRSSSTLSFATSSMMIYPSSTIAADSKGWPMLCVILRRLSSITPSSSPCSAASTIASPTWRLSSRGRVRFRRSLKSATTFSLSKSNSCPSWGPPLQPWWLLLLVLVVLCHRLP
jgi:hypothetical protein